jgi:replication factor C subunit 2/4
LELILKLAGGDLRKAITYLQTAQRLHAAAVPPEPVSAISSEFTCTASVGQKNEADKVVHEISGVVPVEIIDMLLNAVGVDRSEGIVQELHKGGFEVVRTAIKKVGREGWSAGQVLEQVSDQLCAEVREVIADFTAT